MMHMMRRMLILDPNLKFVSVSEFYGKLKVDFVLSNKEVRPEMLDLLYKAQNRLDYISHGLVNRTIIRESETKDKDENVKWLLVRGVLHTNC